MELIDWLSKEKSLPWLWFDKKFLYQKQYSLVYCTWTTKNNCLLGLSGQIYRYYGFEAIYSTALIVQTLAILYACFIVEESKTKIEGEELDFSKIFSLDHMTDSFGVAFKYRPEGLR